MEIGCQTEFGQIRHLLLKHPKKEYINQKSINDQWQKINYTACTNYEKALTEYDEFIALLNRIGVKIEYLPENENTGLDSIYVHDPVLVTKNGAILCNMGKTERSGEPDAIGDYFKSIGIPILGQISGDGRLEGGDVVWLDDKTLAVGEGYRTNAEGIRQLREMTSSLADEFMVTELPHWNGPGECLHLMSNISPVDKDLAVVYSRLLSTPFREWLIGRGIRFVEVPDSEYDTMACNVLAIAPGKCIMLSGNPKTKQALEKAGAEVWEFDGAEISHKGAGGPTCLTRPILRD